MLPKIAKYPFRHSLLKTCVLAADVGLGWRSEILDEVKWLH